jgi:hypothetical protein
MWGCVSISSLQAIPVPSCVSELHYLGASYRTKYFRHRVQAREPSGGIPVAFFRFQNFNNLVFIKKFILIYFSSSAKRNTKEDTVTIPNHMFASSGAVCRIALNWGEYVATSCKTIVARIPK